MSWLHWNDSLTKLKGQVTTFATDVLQDINEGASSLMGNEETEQVSDAFAEERTQNVETSREKFDDIESIEDVNYLRRIIAQLQEEKTEFLQKLDLLDTEHHENMMELVSHKHQLEMECKAMKSASEEQKKELQTIYSSLKHESEQKLRLEKQYEEKVIENEQLLGEIRKTKSASSTEDDSSLEKVGLQGTSLILEHDSEQPSHFEQKYKDTLVENKELLSQIGKLESENEKLRIASGSSNTDVCKKCSKSRQDGSAQTIEITDDNNALKCQIMGLQNENADLCKSLKDYEIKSVACAEEYSDEASKYKRTILELQNKVDALKDKVAELHNTNGDLIEKINKSYKKSQRLENMYEAFSEQEKILLELQSEHDILRASKEALELDKNQMTNVLEEHALKHKTLEIMAQEAQQVKKLLESENGLLKDELETVDAQKGHLEKTLQEYRDKLQKYEELADTQSQEQQILVDLEAENTLLKTTVEELQSQNAQHQENIAQYIVKIEGYETMSEKAAQEKKLQTELQNKNEVLKTRTEHLSIENNKLKKDIREYEVRLQNYDDLDLQNSSLKNEVEALKDENTQLIQTTKELKAAIHDYEAVINENSRAENNLAELSNENEALKNEVNHLRRERENKEELLLENTKHSETMQAENESLRIRIEGLESEQNNLHSSLEEYEHIIQAKGNTSTESSKENNTILDLKTEIDVLIKKIENLEAENEDLRKHLGDELRHTKEELKTMIDNNDSLKKLLKEGEEEIQMIRSEESTMKLENSILTKELASANEMKQNLHVTVVHILNYIRNLSNSMSAHIDTLEADYNNIGETRNELKNFIKYWEDKCAALENANNLSIIIEKELEVLAKHINFILYILKNSQVDLKSVIKEKNELATSLSSLLDLSRKLVPCENANVKHALSVNDSIKYICDKLNMDNLKENVSTLSSEDLKRLKDENDRLKEKCESLSASLLDEQSNNQHLMKEKSRLAEQESILNKKLERLQAHLIEVEEHYTQELVQTEEKQSALQQKVKEIEESETNYSNLYKSVSIRANQKLETLQSQSQLLIKERDNLKRKLLDAELRNEEHVAALTNLHNVLEQFQKDKDLEVKLEAQKIRKQVDVEKKVQEELKNEIVSLKQQLEQSKQGLYAASRLTNQLEASQRHVALLKDEIAGLQHRLSEAEASLSKKSEDKVEKTLIKNLIISAFSYNKEIDGNQEQILKIITHVLDFTQEDKDRLFNQREASTWLKLFGTSARGPDSHDESLAQEFVKFLQSESNPRQVKSFSQVETEPRTSGRDRKPSNASILSDIALPTFGNFAENRSSSSILKDVLKENR